MISAMRLVLASASSRRAELLTAADYQFEVHAVEIDERPRDGESPAVYVERLAQEKSGCALGELTSAGNRAAELLVIGADTAVVVDAEILGKPLDVQDGRRMLRRLSGRAHEVLTGISVRWSATALSVVESTAVWFSALTDEQIDWYVASGEGRDKAGGYAIQGLASRFIPRIDGSYSNVVGLPIAAVERLFQRLEREAGIVASRG
jgi:septum formation protein